MIIKTQSDRQIFLNFCEYGKKALLYRQKCIGLLPEIYRRHIHEQQGYQSIFEFAAKYAGISQEQVKRVLSLDERFQDKPALKIALESGEVSVNKLARIAAIASPENQEELAMQARLLSKNALETLARDIKAAPAAASSNADLTNRENPMQSGFVPGHKIFSTNTEKPEQLIELMAEKSLKLSPEVIARLRGLKEKGLDINQIIIKSLDRRESEIEQEKQQIAAHPPQKISRHIPMRVQKVLQSEHGDRCSIPGCEKSSEIIHHTRRFALDGRHDPRYLAPLCSGHHELAHTVDLVVKRKQWQALWVEKTGQHTII